MQTTIIRLGARVTTTKHRKSTLAPLFWARHPDLERNTCAKVLRFVEQAHVPGQFSPYFRSQFTPKAPKELQLPRWALARLIAARSGHGDFQEYHKRMGHQDFPYVCSYGRPKGPIHFYLYHKA